MNRESLHNNDSAGVETLEVQEHAPVVVESKESSLEFADKILNRIKGYVDSFIHKKEAIEKVEKTVPLDDLTTKERIKNDIGLESQLDEIDNEAQKIQTEASDNVNLTVREFSKSYHDPKYRNEVAKKIIEARKLGGDVEAVRNGFYNETAGKKESFESQEKERSIAEIMKEKNLVIVHAIPLTSFERKSTRENNPVLKSNGYQDFKTSVEIVSGLSPTISTSIPSPDKNGNGLYYPSGIILGEGKILSARSGDSGSVAHGMYKRIPKFGRENQTAIQSEINIDKVVEEGNYYNELTVESPQVAGLFYDLTEDAEPPLENPKKNELLENMVRYSEIRPSEEELQKEADRMDKKWHEYIVEQQSERDEKRRSRKFQLYKMKKYSEEMRLPLYVFKKEQGELKKYKVTFLSTINPESETIEEADYVLEEVTAKDIYESKKDIPSEERAKMIEDIKSKGVLSDSAEKEVDKKFKNL